MTVKNCPNCAAPLPMATPDAGQSCEFCHTVVKHPEPPILDAEIIEEQPPGGGEPEWIKALRRELREVKSEHAQQVVRTLLSVFLVLLPGLGLGIGGTLGFAFAGRVLYAAICLVSGVAVAGIGIALIVNFGLGQTRCNERIRDLERRIGIDNRTRGEKMVDRGMDWMFGKE